MKDFIFISFDALSSSRSNLCVLSEVLNFFPSSKFPAEIPVDGAQEGLGQTRLPHPLPPPPPVLSKVDFPICPFVQIRGENFIGEGDYEAL